MRGRTNDGDLVTIAPATAADVEIGEAVLVKWRRGNLLGLVTAVRGQWVSRRQLIAKVGQTRVADESHLHFSMKFDGDMINPLKCIALKQL